MPNSSFSLHNLSSWQSISSILWYRSKGTSCCTSNSMHIFETTWIVLFSNDTVVQGDIPSFIFGWGKTKRVILYCIKYGMRQIALRHSVITKDENRSAQINFDKGTLRWELFKIGSMMAIFRLYGPYIGPFSPHFCPFCHSIKTVCVTAWVSNSTPEMMHSWFRASAPKA